MPSDVAFHLRFEWTVADDATAHFSTLPRKLADGRDEYVKTFDRIESTDAHDQSRLARRITRRTKWNRRQVHSAMNDLQAIARALGDLFTQPFDIELRNGHRHVGRFNLLLEKM